jgi:uncharacterized membrane protein YfcA
MTRHSIAQVLYFIICNCVTGYLCYSGGLVFALLLAPILLGIYLQSFRYVAGIQTATAARSRADYTRHLSRMLWTIRAGQLALAGIVVGYPLLAMQALPSPRSLLIAVGSVLLGYLLTERVRVQRVARLAF